MASKRAKKRAQCSGKKPWTRKEAVAEASKMGRTFKGEQFDAYKCPSCGNWHVGHRPYHIRKIIEGRRGRR